MSGLGSAGVFTDSPGRASARGSLRDVLSRGDGVGGGSAGSVLSPGSVLGAVDRQSRTAPVSPDPTATIRRASLLKSGSDVGKYKENWYPLRDGRVCAEDGWISSVVSSFNGREIRTASGSVYHLGSVHPVLQGAIAVSGMDYKPDKPLRDTRRLVTICVSVMVEIEDYNASFGGRNVWDVPVDSKRKEFWYPKKDGRLYTADGWRCSIVDKFNGRRVTTTSGSVYHLGTIHPVLLGALASKGMKFKPELPLAGIRDLCTISESVMSTITEYNSRWPSDSAAVYAPPGDSSLPSGGGGSSDSEGSYRGLSPHGGSITGRGGTSSTLRGGSSRGDGTAGRDSKYDDAFPSEGKTRTEDVLSPFRTTTGPLPGHSLRADPSTPEGSGSGRYSSDGKATEVVRSPWMRRSVSVREVSISDIGVVGVRPGVVREFPLSQIGVTAFNKIMRLSSEIVDDKIELPRGHGLGLESRILSPKLNLHAPLAPGRKSPVKDAAERTLEALLQPDTWVPPRPDSAFDIMPIRALLALCNEVHDIVSKESTMLRVHAPAKIFGDIHGQFSDLLSFFQLHGTPHPPDKADIGAFHYVFLGDYVDRGPHSLEVVATLFSLKVLYPKQIHLIRGNHEDQGVNARYGFLDECRRRLPGGSSREFGGEPAGKVVYDAINKAFHQLPLAALLSERILCVHGGLGPSIKSLEDIMDLPRGVSVTAGGGVQELTWADPAPTDMVTGYMTDPRGRRGEMTLEYGADKVEEFRKRTGVQLIVRAHEPVGGGWEFFDAGHLITVFSAPRYCGRANNFGGMLVVNNVLRVTAKVVPPDYVRVPADDLSRSQERARLVPQHRPPTPPRHRPDGK